MNRASYLCRYLAEHPDDWDERLYRDYDLRIRREGDYAIFNYYIEANFSDPIVQEARGIILDVTTLEVVCWPFRKFGNHTEYYADPIDWSSARVLEKIDGSIVKLWWDAKRNAWRWSTNKSIDADIAAVDEHPGLTYGAVIRRAEGYGAIDPSTLDKTLTYLFELVSPDTCVVIRYDNAKLYHIGTRSCVTGQECEVDVGVDKPGSYPLTSLADCVEAAASLNSGVQDGSVEHEGFVVVDKDYHRVKIKSVDYVTRHRVAMMSVVSKEECVRLLIEQSGRLDSLCALNPDVEPCVRFYAYELSRLFQRADKMAELATNLYAEYSHDRRAVASVIASHPLSFVGFRAMQDGLRGRDVLCTLPIEKLCKYLPTFVPVDLMRELSESAPAKQK